ncbi:Asp23/Gls24 family envelope stress response protein [Streptosporangium sandarakinum]|uniref:Asp23/Gls24 family envelope stress response protein n=1 Tax=Streptosporangium sandarakinum TaxID=1260955 RepID=UPI00369F8FB6
MTAPAGSAPPAPADVPPEPGGVPAREPARAGPAPAAVPPERRGRTDIPERVVARIAAQAAGEVPHVHRVRERGALTPGGTQAVVHDELAVLELDVSVDYPVPLRHVAEEIRRHVARRVHDLTGLSVGHIDIGVTDLVPSRGDDMS